MYVCTCTGEGERRVVLAIYAKWALCSLLKLIRTADNALLSFHLNNHPLEADESLPGKRCAKLTAHRYFSLTAVKLEDTGLLRPMHSSFLFEISTIDSASRRDEESHHSQGNCTQLWKSSRGHCTLFFFRPKCKFVSLKNQASWFVFCVILSLDKIQPIRVEVKPISYIPNPPFLITPCLYASCPTWQAN